MRPVIPFHVFRIQPPLDDGEQRARYGRAARARAAFTPHHLPHTIIAGMMRERACMLEAVSACPVVHRLGRRLESHLTAGLLDQPMPLRTGDCMCGPLMWYWAIDEIWYDHLYECFVAMYADRPQAYMSPELAVWAIISWSEWGGKGYLSDAHYAEWLAWHHCKPWMEVVAGLEARGEVAAGAVASVAACPDVFEAPESQEGGAEYARILMWPQEPAAAHRPAGARRQVGNRDGPWPPAAAVDHLLTPSSSCPPTAPPVPRGQRTALLASTPQSPFREFCPSAPRRRKAGILASIARAMRLA